MAMKTQGLGAINFSAVTRSLLIGVVIVLVSSCASQQATQQAAAVVESERVAEQQAVAELARERARAQEEQMDAERLARFARLEAEREREEREGQAELARAAEEKVRAQRDVDERRRQEIAQRAEEKQTKLDRIAQLEQQISDIETRNTRSVAASAKLAEAVTVAENLLDVLNAEQAKYRNTDAAGNTVERLSRDLIVELERKKDELVRDAQLLSDQN